MPVEWPADRDAVVDFLSAHPWPFHTQPHLTRTDAADVEVHADGVAAYWIVDDGEPIGLVRLLDLDDVDDGSPVFDLRLADGHRGRGVGGRAVRWLTRHLFATYPGLHRIEATTRADNVAMQHVLARCGYRLEGRLVEAWFNADGTRHDTLVYAILRREHTPTAGDQ